ncbi:hypothetical protein [Paraburkholderia sp. Cpub6]|uniref:hypothetical protein n=1 Tax=Paraburkholderia sp. Cpub6 TaxID=2723094 RepID=UPI00160D049C|nr:hypothetical protein [Paraburkholderia sp. Cpub6]MBB5459012.1 hypothetical protein [Paraburkholderia sp. Cpub6]
MDTGKATFSRLVADVVGGLAFWVARQPEREINPAPLVLTPEARREYDRLRKRRQRARVTGRPV